MNAWSKHAPLWLDGQVVGLVLVPEEEVPVSPLAGGHWAPEYRNGSGELGTGPKETQIGVRNKLQSQIYLTD